MKKIFLIVVLLSTLLFSCEKGNVTNSGKDCVDYEGNVYNTVEIGHLTWMAENLRSVKYSDGKSIGVMNMHCYENDEANLETYGRLYDLNTAMRGSTEVESQGICPNGWHIPSVKEWEILVYEFGGPEVAGGALKEAGYAHWEVPNEGATNSSGFTALPVGYSDGLNHFSALSKSTVFWSSDVSDYGLNASTVIMTYSWEGVGFGSLPKTHLLPVRCVKNY